MKKKILIVDDEKSILDSIRLVLEDEGYSVKCARDGLEALDLIKASNTNGGSLHLIITDLRMPKMSGIELMKELKDESIEIPLITITGFHDRGTMLDTIKHGCDAYLTKPINMAKLLDEISKCTLRV